MTKVPLWRAYLEACLGVPVALLLGWLWTTHRITDLVFMALFGLLFLVVTTFFWRRCNG